MFSLKATWEKLSRLIPSFKKQVKGDLEEAGRFYRRKLQLAVSIPYPPVSSPGKPPHKRTGVGQRSIRVDPGATTLQDGDVIISVGFDAAGIYMEWLDEGSVPFVAARPFILETYNTYYSDIHRIAKGGK